MIKTEMNNDLYHMIKNIKKVSGFLGTKGVPVPVSDEEIETLKKVLTKITQNLEKDNG